MANSVPLKTKERYQDGLIDPNSDAVYAVLVETGSGHFVYNASTHGALSDIASGDRIAQSSNLANKSITNGVFDADDVFVDTSAASGRAVGAIVVICDHGGTDATRYILAYLDTGTGLPFTTNANGVNIRWDNGANKITALTGT